MSNTMKEIYKSYAKRFLLCIGSLIFFGLGNAWGVKAAAAGTNAWSTLSIGVADKLGTTFGIANMGIGVIIIIIDLIGKGKLGFGSLINFVFVAIFSDMWLAILQYVPDPPNLLVGVIYTLLGQIILSFANVAYMKPALGAGPRDTLLVIVGKKVPKVPIGAVKFVIEMLALFAGVLMGAPFGIGTVLVVALQATLFQFACKVLRFEPRSVKNDDFVDTIRALTGKGA